MIRKYWFVGDDHGVPTLRILKNKSLHKSLSAPQATKEAAQDNLSDWEANNPKGQFSVYRADITLERESK